MHLQSFGTLHYKFLCNVPLVRGFTGCIPLGAAASRYNIVKFTIFFLEVGRIAISVLKYVMRKKFVSADFQIFRAILITVVEHI